MNGFIRNRSRGFFFFNRAQPTVITPYGLGQKRILIKSYQSKIRRFPRSIFFFFSISL